MTAWRRRISGSISRPARSISRGPDEDVVASIAELDAQSLDRVHHLLALRFRRQRRARARGQAPRSRGSPSLPAIPRRCRRPHRLRRRPDSAARSARRGPRADRPASTAAGCCGATPATPARRDRRAATARRRGARSAARVAGSMKAPPPVASTWTGCASSRAMTRRSPSRNTRSPRLAKISSMRLAGGGLDLGDPNRRTADRGAPRGGGRSCSSRPPSDRPGRWCGSARTGVISAAFRSDSAASICASPLTALSPCRPTGY